MNYYESTTFFVLRERVALYCVYAYFRLLFRIYKRVVRREKKAIYPTGEKSIRRAEIFPVCLSNFAVKKKMFFVIIAHKTYMVRYKENSLLEQISEIRFGT